MKHKHYIIVLSLGLLIIFLSACSSGNQPVQRVREQAVQVVVASPLISTDSSLSVTGQVESAHTAAISTRVMGYITAIHVKVGDAVRQGQLVVAISDADIRAKLAQADAMLSAAQTNFNSAEKDFTRFTNLFNQKSASAKELDNVTLQYEAARAAVESAKQMKAEARSMLAYTNITAPFSGVVAQKLADAGSIANPGMPILMLEQPHQLRINAVIPETEITRVKLKAAAIITVQSAGKTYDGQVVEISPSSVGTGGQYLVKISLPATSQTELKAGMYANVKITAAANSTALQTESVLIPLSAVNHIGQMNALYVLSDSSTALLRYVRLGKIYGDNVEILSGLTEKERFIVTAKGKLYNGLPVSIN